MIGGLLKTQAWEEVAKEAGFKVGRMALLCAVSERQLQRIFSQRIGCTPRRWLRELQCRLAKDLIQRGYTAKAVAAEMRFANEPHFCREFKKVFGASPMSFSPRPATNLKVVPLDKQPGPTIPPLPSIPDLRTRPRRPQAVGK